MKKVNFDYDLWRAIKTAKNIVYRTLDAGQEHKKYRKKRNLKVGGEDSARWLHLEIRIDSDEEFTYEFKVEFTDFYKRPIKSIIRLTTLKFDDISNAFYEFRVFATPFLD
ncbi:MAG: hypothetical protein IKZ59_01355 [Clostridia bacterium]|nr:hypothetical protein [Clostridia bacterium]